MILLQVSDFQKCFQQIATSIHSTDLLQSYIDRYEKAYIVQLLGKELAELFIADIAAPSPQAKYLTLKNEFYEQDDNDCIYHSRGMKEFLLSAVFYEYVSNEQLYHSQSGVVEPQAETSTVSAPVNAHRLAETRWNEALPTIRAIQWKCYTDAPDDYPTYKGQTFKARSAIFL